MLHKPFQPMTRPASRRWAWALALLTIAACYSLATPFYGSCDEDGMRAMLEGRMGADGMPYPYMVWVNAIIGHLLVPLYRLWPNGYWYDLYMLACLAISAATILAIFLRNTPDPITRFATAALAMGWLAITVLSVTFSLTSGMLLAAGWLAFLDTFHRPSTRPRDYLPAAALLIVSSFTRIDIFLHLLPLLCAASLPFLIRRLPSHRHLFRAAAILGLIYLAAYGFLWWDNHFSVPGVADFWRFNDLRVQVVDYLNSGAIDNHTIRPILAKAGWSVEQYKLLESWFFYDTTLYNTETLQRLVDAFQSSHLPFRGSAPYPPLVDSQRAYLILLLFLPLLARNPIHAVYMTALALFFAAIYMGTTAAYKSPPGYVVAAIALTMTLLGIYAATVWPNASWKLPRLLALIPVLLMASILLHLLGDAGRYDRRAKLEQDERTEMLAADSAPIIITWGPMYLYTRPFHPLPVLPGRTQINGASFAPLPYMQAILKHHAIDKNFTEQLCARDDIAILGNLDADRAMPQLERMAHHRFERIYDGAMHRLYRCRRS